VFSSGMSIFLSLLPVFHKVESESRAVTGFSLRRMNRSSKRLKCVRFRQASAPRGVRLEPMGHGTQEGCALPQG
jgi:hypothetical protein